MQEIGWCGLTPLSGGDMYLLMSIQSKACVYCTEYRGEVANVLPSIYIV